MAVASARCTSCPPNMYTSDKWGTAAPATGYKNQTECLVDAGWGTTETSVDICQVGFYNVGQNRLPCTPCDNGYTTLGTNSTSVNNCVIKAGWFYDAGKSLPAPCDKGTYSAGGDANTREPTSCTACATGYSTQEQESESADDCGGEHQCYFRQTDVTDSLCAPLCCAMMAIALCMPVHVCNVLVLWLTACWMEQLLSCEHHLSVVSRA